jgi:hypothetical protein
MNPNLSNVIFHILNNLKDKEFSYHSDDTSSPTLGRQGNEFFITSGKLARPFEIKLINSNTVECTIKVSWHSKRCKYEFIQTATENRTDYAIYIFTATLDDSTQIVSIKEVDWIPFDKDPTFQRRLDINYRAAVYAKKGLEERLIQPLSGHIKSLSSENNRFVDKESILSYFRDHYNIHVVLQGDFMAGDRNINMGSGNYLERIQGDYVQGNYYAAGQPQSLAQAAAEIQKLLKQLEQTYPTTTTSQQMVVAAEAINRIESNPTMKQKVINAVKEGGLAAFEKAIDNPAGAFIVGAIKGWQEVEAED